ncbi:hypothetical protein NKH77_53435 [Streptomyces sp. M19]
MHCQQTDLVVRHATPELRARLLPRIAAGEVYLASVTTESGKGGHLLSAHDALQVADGLALDREAPVVTGDARGRFPRHHARRTRRGATRGDARLRRRRGPEGRTDRRLADHGHARHAQRGVRLTGRVAPDCVVGERGRFRQVAADSMVPVGHLAWSACWLGAARAAFGQLVRWITAHGQKSGGPDAASPLVQERVARIRLDLELVSAYLGKVTEEVSQIRPAAADWTSPPSRSI